MARGLLRTLGVNGSPSSLCQSTDYGHNFYIQKHNSCVMSKFQVSMSFFVEDQFNSFSAKLDFGHKSFVIVAVSLQSFKIGSTALEADRKQGF